MYGIICRQIGQKFIRGRKLVFKGIAKEFSLLNEDQYNTIGDFWDEMALIYGLENLQGLGYKWENGKISYAIGLKNGEIADCDLCMDLPNDGWTVVNGITDNLKEIYNEIYKQGALTYEIETFDSDGTCQIKYFR